MSTDEAQKDLSIHPATRRERWLYAAVRTIAVNISRLVFVGGVVGRENVPTEGAFVVVPIHRSYIDWLIVPRISRRRLRFLVKGEVWRVRVVGFLLQILGAFAVQRGAADRDAIRRALGVLEAGELLVVFPEGTRGFGSKVQTIQEGAAYLALRAGVPVIPVGMAGVERAMPRGSKFPRPARVVVAVGPPIMSAVRPVERLGEPLRVPRSLTTALTGEIRAAIEEAQMVAEQHLLGR